MEKLKPILVSLKAEIPMVSEDSEGFLKGGFVSIAYSDPEALANTNCPGDGGSCSSNGSGTITNINCPNKGGTCTGGIESTCNATNLNCPVSGGSCSETTLPTTTEETTSPIGLLNAGLSTLI